MTCVQVSDSRPHGAEYDGGACSPRVDRADPSLISALRRRMEFRDTIGDQEGRGENSAAERFVPSPSDTDTILPPRRARSRVPVRSQSLRATSTPNGQQIRTIQSSPPIVRIHHISDVHIGPLHNRPSRKILIAPDRHTDWGHLRHYFRYLQRSKVSELPDLVVFSGDVTSFAEEASFSRAAEVFAQIVEILQRKRGWRTQSQPCLFLVPGNHDLNWLSDEETFEGRIERYLGFCKKLPRDLIVTAVSAGHAPSHYDFGPPTNLQICTFNTCLLGGVPDPAIIEIRDRVAAVLETRRTVLPRIERLLELRVATADEEAEAQRLVATLAQQYRLDPGYVDLASYDGLSRELRDDRDDRVRIAVMHHNLASLPAADIEQYDSIINAGEVKHWLAQHGFDLVLHGHRHFPHVHYEEYLGRYIPGSNGSLGYQQGMFFVSGETLGCRMESGFIELEISDAHVAHATKPPSSLVKVFLDKQQASDSYHREEVAHLLIDRPTTRNLRVIQEHLGRAAPANVKSDVRSAIDAVGPALRQLQAECDDLSFDAQWQDEFAQWLPRLGYVWGVDVIGPGSWLTPRYLRETAHRFRYRRLAGRSEGSSTVGFSPDVYRAIQETEWDPNNDRVNGERQCKPRIRERRWPRAGLEMARILIWDEYQLSQRDIISMIDSWHNLFSVPVFVLPAPLSPPIPGGFVEYVVGGDRRGRVACAYGLVASTKRTVRVDKRTARAFRDHFQRLLRARSLTTLQTLLKA